MANREDIESSEDVDRNISDPLLECLLYLGKLYHRPLSRDGVTAGLPLVNGRLTPSLFVRAAERAGFSAKLVRRGAAAIPSVVLPAVAIMRDDGVCMVTDKKGKKFTILHPENPDAPQLMEQGEFKKHYGGYCIFVRPMAEDAPVFGKNPDDQSRFGKWKWFWGALWHFKSYYVKVLIAAVLINLFSIASPLFIMNVYDRVIPHMAMETLWVLASGAAIVFGFEFILRILRGYFIDFAGKRIDQVVSSSIYEQIMGLSLDKRMGSSGAMAQQVRGYDGVREFITSATLATVVDLPFVFLFVWIIFILGGSIGCVPLIAGLGIMAFGIGIQLPLAYFTRQGYSSGLARNSLLVESIVGIESIKGAGGESFFQGRMEELIRRSGQLEARSRWITGMVGHLTAFTAHMVTVGIVVMGVYKIQAGTMSVGALIACVILSGKSIAPIGPVANLLTRLQNSINSHRSLSKLMKLPRESNPASGGTLIKNAEPSLDFRSVTFSYPGQEHPVIKDLSVKINSGERVAIIGKVGSGKSTMLRLAMRLYRPKEGIVAYSGKDVQQLHPSEFRQQIGYVSQDPWLFAGKIRDNIMLGTPEVEFRELEKATTRAGLGDFLAQHPQGYDLMIGERGDTLSGGQRQAVTLARALLKEPRLLVLDEPTSQLDMMSERLFVERVRAYLDEDPTRTMVLATHRPALFSLVERIIVMDDGKIVADGPPDQILPRLRGDSGGKKAPLAAPFTPKSHGNA